MILTKHSTARGLLVAVLVTSYAALPSLGVLHRAQHAAESSVASQDADTLSLATEVAHDDAAAPCQICHATARSKHTHDSNPEVGEALADSGPTVSFFRRHTAAAKPGTLPLLRAPPLA